MKIKRLNNLGFSHLLVIALIVVGVGVVGTFAIVKSNASTPCVKRTFRQGSKGNCVKAIQAALNHYSSSRPKVDGKYGPQTVKYVKLFQKNRRLAADGMVGPHTWKHICVDLRDQPRYYRVASCNKV